MKEMRLHRRNTVHVKYPYINVFFRIFENLDFWKFDPIILCSFLWRLRITRLESHNSKQMMVYEQITKNLIYFFCSKNWFFGLKNGNRNRDEPEPEGTGTGLNRSRPKLNRTVPNRGIPDPSRPIPTHPDPEKQWKTKQLFLNLSPRA